MKVSNTALIEENNNKNTVGLYPRSGKHGMGLENISLTLCKSKSFKCERNYLNNEDCKDCKYV